MKLFLFFLFIISTNENELKLVKIPFELYFPETITTNNIIETLSDIRLITKIKIGSNNEELPLILDLEKYPIYISGTNTSINQKFNENLSKDFKALDNKKEIITKDKDYIKGYIASDNLSLNEHLKKINFIFFLSTYNKYAKSGTLGLQFHYENNFNDDMKKTHIINQLKEKNLISNKCFFFRFNKNDKNKGELIIGLLPHEQNKNLNIKNYKTARVSNWQSYHTWRISLSDVRINNNSIYDYECNDLISFNSNSLLIKAPINFIKYIENDFFHQNGCEKLLLNDTRTYYFYCNDSVDIKKFPNLFFSYKFENQINFTFTYKDLFFKINNKHFFLIISGLYNWEFGILFLQKYETIFNQEIKTIGWYEIEKQNYFSSIILIIIIFILLFIILFLLIFIRKKFIRKRRKNEINDNYEYIPEIF